MIERTQQKALVFLFDLLYLVRWRGPSLRCRALAYLLVILISVRSNRCLSSVSCGFVDRAASVDAAIAVTMRTTLDSPPEVLADLLEHQTFTDASVYD